MSQEPTHEHIHHLFESIEPKREEVTTITTTPFLPDLADILIEILSSHHIHIDRRMNTYLIRFPVGTSKIELLPRTRDQRYQILLPDGFELREVLRRGDTYSYLQCDTNTLTPEQQERLKSTY